jgi:hypothetical protein
MAPVFYFWSSVYGWNIWNYQNLANELDLVPAKNHHSNIILGTQCTGNALAWGSNVPGKHRPLFSWGATSLFLVVVQFCPAYYFFVFRVSVNLLLFYLCYHSKAFFRQKKMDLPRSPFAALRNFASLGNRGPLSPVKKQVRYIKMYRYRLGVNSTFSSLRHLT